MRPGAEHLILELNNCPLELLTEQDRLVEVLETGICESGLGLVQTYAHQYQPSGLTAVAIIKESHVVVHTYPEAAHASIDIFTCSPEQEKCTCLAAYFTEAFSPANVKTAELQRGGTLSFKRPNWINLSSIDGIEVSLQITETLYSGVTQFQKIDVVRSPHFGKMLVLDGELQASESDVDIYNREMVRPLLDSDAELKKVLVLGGGDGGVVCELLNAGAEQVVVVEIDPQVIDICTAYLPEISKGAFQDPRVSVVNSEAGRYLRESNELFDAVVCDLTMHPEAFIDCPRGQYLREVFHNITERMDPGALITTQCASELDCKTLELLRGLLENGFSELAFTRQFIPSFSGRWVFASGRVRSN